jgi:4'-phosphopantetheinyl transferase
VAERFLAAPERDALAGLEGDELTRAFFELWTAKEALVKALGTGLSRALDSFTVLPFDQSGAARVRFLEGRRPTAAWYVHALSVEPACQAALATTLADPALGWFELER